MGSRLTQGRCFVAIGALALGCLGPIVAAPPASAATVPANVSISFTPPAVAVAGSTSLSFAISNPNPGTGLTSVGFTDTLPAGVVVANPSALANGCDGTAVAAPGSSSVSLTGASLSPGVACFLSVAVTGVAAGDHTDSVTIGSSAGTGNTASAALGVGAPVGGALLVKRVAPAGRPVAVGSTLFFAAGDGTHGVELWRSDGTGAGTKLVKDIDVGGSANPNGLTAVGSTLFFAADDGTHGVELWRSDGTAAGTKLVKNIAPSGGAFPSELTRVGSRLFFAADDGTHGDELFTSDGTAAGTKLVKDVDPAGSAFPSELTAVGSTAFFVADDGAHGVELWRSDGTAAGTTLVKDIDPSGAANPSTVTNVGGTLFFGADDGTRGTELWRSDGTRAGTSLVKDIDSGGDSFPSDLTAVGGALFFAANDGAHGVELWRSDGTRAGTRLVRDINGAGDGAPADLTSVGGTVYFAADDGRYGTEVWSSDGTVAGTRLLADVDPGGASSPTGLATLNGSVLFAATDAAAGTALWRGARCGSPHAPSRCGVPTTLTTALSAGALTPGDPVTDQATVNGADPLASGTIKYTVYADDHCGTVETRATPAHDAVVHGAAPASKTVSFATTGTFWWRATYSGDAASQTLASVSGCASEPLIVQPWAAGDLTTYTQNSWTETPGSTRLSESFNSVYSTGSVAVGGGFDMRFTSAGAIFAYIPTTGFPGALTKNLVDPTSSSSGIFGGNVLALQLDVDLDDAGRLPATSGLRFGDLTLCGLTTAPTGDDISPANGMSVRQFLAASNTALGGDTAFMNVDRLDQLSRLLIRAFDGGVPNAFAQSNLVNGPCP